MLMQIVKKVLVLISQKSTNAYIDLIKSISIENVNITYEDSAKSTRTH